MVPTSTAVLKRCTASSTPAAGRQAAIDGVRALAVVAVLKLPTHADLFHGMLVITPLTSLFKIICLVLAFFTVILVDGDRTARNQGEYLALILLATIGLMLLVGSEELLMIFIGLELTELLADLPVGGVQKFYQCRTPSWRETSL